jgi:signal transduction histidine kinase
VREAEIIAGPRLIRRIALASGLVVALIAAALLVTVWSYQNALDAHSRADAATSEKSASHAAETYLSREREAMNEYLLNPREEVRAEILADQAGFQSNISKVGIGQTQESALVQRAIVANAEFISVFARNPDASVGRPEAFRRLDAELDTSQKRVFDPLSSLRALDASEGQELEASSVDSRREAFLFAIFAGVLAIAGGLGFTLYSMRLVRDIGSRNERLSELDRIKDDFVASVSHELRTPLTSIRGYLELMREGQAGQLTEEQQHFVSIVERNADRLLRLVGDLLFVAQLKAGEITLEPGPTDVEELVAQAVEAARPAAAEKGIELDVALDGLSELHADRARLAQVLDNLISNALKFTSPGGHVTVRACRHAEVVVLEVSDDGMGMSEKDQEQIFQRFFRTTSATDRAIQGTGLGLAIVKAIVEAHHGVISVASVVGQGTIFRVELPQVAA